MEVGLIIFFLLIVYFIFKKNDKPIIVQKQQVQKNEKLSRDELRKRVRSQKYETNVNIEYEDEYEIFEGKKQRFKIAIPKGYRIYFNQMEVSGTHFHQKDTIKAFSNNKMQMIIEDEKDNEHDKNALKIIITNKDNEKYHIGYIPKEISKIIAEDKLLDYIAPRLKYINFYNQDNLIVEFDILGLKSEYSKLSKR